MSRTVEQAKVIWAQVLPLRRAGYDLIPLTARRTPWKGWRRKDYTHFAFLDHIMGGGAVGVRLGDEHLVVDVDPRNGGEDSFTRLIFDIGEELDRADVPAVRSGGGGLHLYFRKSPGRTRVTLPKLYPGIDFKRLGGYVVAPGNDHPSGGTYVWLRPLERTGAPQAPNRLLALLHRPPGKVGPVEAVGEPVLTPDELAKLLAVVPAANYRDYDEWLTISMACHHATGGGGFEVWADWCASDDDYSSVPAEELFDHWDSFTSGGGVTYRTLFKAVSDAGRGALLRGIGEKVYEWDELFGAVADDEVVYDAWGNPEEPK